MESNFFSGSENLYKYLVSIGILMLVLTIYYPLKQKQELELLKLNLQSDLTVLNLELKDNKKKVDDLTIHINDKKISTEEKKKILTEIKNKQKENEINQIKSDCKMQEINSRQYYISLYTKLFWITTILGIALVFFGFYKWIIAKKVEDKKSKFETDILEIKYKNDKEEYERNHNAKP